ncbi:hypothetical protein J6590_042076 [Homalodisca vitripennis]|nr:hypothetical protein J6590_042076 [Homalodisca vitripennis]
MYISTYALIEDFLLTPCGASPNEIKIRKSMTSGSAGSTGGPDLPFGGLLFVFAYLWPPEGQRLISLVSPTVCTFCYPTSGCPYCPAFVTSRQPSGHATAGPPAD